METIWDVAFSSVVSRLSFRKFGIGGLCRISDIGRSSLQTALESVLPHTRFLLLYQRPLSLGVQSFFRRVETVAGYGRSIPHSMCCVLVETACLTA